MQGKTSLFIAYKIINWSGCNLVTKKIDKNRNKINSLLFIYHFIYT